MPSIAAMTGRLIASPLLLLGATDAVDIYWEVSSGKCKRDNLCITSPNYPNKYGNSERCTIDVKPGFQGAWVQEFETEAMFDALTVNDRDYSGSFRPTYDTLPGGGKITFTSNSALTHMGWKLCPKDRTKPMWTVTGNCPLYNDQCITSLFFPRDYPNEIHCEITYPAGFGGVDIAHIDTDPLDTLDFDSKLVLGGGAPPFLNPRPGSQIRWTSDASDDGAAMRRWKICQQSPDVVKKVDQKMAEGIRRQQALDPTKEVSPLGGLDTNPGAYESMPSSGARESMPTHASMAAGVAASSPAVQSIADLAAAPAPRSAGANVAAVVAVGASTIAMAFVTAAAFFRYRGRGVAYATPSDRRGIVGGVVEAA